MFCFALHGRMRMRQITKTPKSLRLSWNRRDSRTHNPAQALKSCHAKQVVLSTRSEEGVQGGSTETSPVI